MSIATKTGDKGQTSLVGGQRVSKADPRVETYGTLDELGSVMGFARSICRNEKVALATKAIQKELFTVSASLASPEDDKKTNRVTQEMVDSLTKQVEELEVVEGIVGDWVLPGEDTVSAAFDVARTVCRRAERAAVRLQDGDVEVEVDALAVTYINRLSDLLWLFGRLVEKDAGVDAKLRGGDADVGRWSKAW